VIRRGTYEHQECHVAALAELAHLIDARAVTAPAIIVIGEVVRLREKLNWFDSAKTKDPAYLPFSLSQLSLAIASSD
jgi:precorrin-4 methylase